MIVSNVDKYFYEDRVFKTHFLSALSSTFKDGESFFMKSITAYLDDCPEFKDRIIQFCKEERTHTEWHMSLNRKLDHLNTNTALQDLEKATGVFLSSLNKLPKIYKLLITESLEHVTYCLCKTAIEEKEFEYLTSDAKTVFLKHSIEETGDSHSSIARDIYKKVGGNKIIRKFSIFPIILVLAFVITKYIIYLYSKNKDFNLDDLVVSSKELFGKYGWVRKAIKETMKTW